VQAALHADLPSASLSKTYKVIPLLLVSTFPFAESPIFVGAVCATATLVTNAAVRGTMSEIRICIILLFVSRRCALTRRRTGRRNIYSNDSNHIRSNFREGTFAPIFGRTALSKAAYLPP
jgi:hypothetical protein